MKQGFKNWPQLKIHNNTTPKVNVTICETLYRTYKGGEKRRSIIKSEIEGWYYDF